jgi:uncharacterized protein (TIGR03790 family)
MIGWQFLVRPWRISALALLGGVRLGSAQIFDEATLKERTAGVHNPDAEATVVVYNENDRDSRELAITYAGRRGIPRDHVLALQCPVAEEITRAEYDRDIAEPLRKAFLNKGWWTLSIGSTTESQEVEKTSIHFVALIRGIPLKIKPQFESYPGDRPSGPPPISTHNEAAVDSELSVLGAGTHQISGAIDNPYFRGFSPIASAAIPSMLLVCRLDAATVETVQRMINDSVITEQEGLRGFAYIDARNTSVEGLKLGDGWLYNAAVIARKRGQPTILDNGEGLFPVMYPMRYAAIYLGWYSQDVAGPFQRPDFRFQRGAVAVHLHSFSGLTLRDPKRFWCAPLLEAGAAATLGNVYEPYLGLTPALDTFYDRLRAGFTFAESAYMSQRQLSWMTTFVGDPLYRPFKRDNDLSARKPNDEWAAYSEGARIWFADGPAAGQAALEASAKKFKSGIILEGLGLLQIAGGDSNAAVGTFAQAARLYSNPEDATRASIHAVLQLKGLNRTPEALALARKQIAAFPKTPAVELLKAIETDMKNPAPKTADSAK